MGTPAFRFTRLAVALCAAVAGAALAAGCQNKLHDENVALHRQNRELQQKLTDTDTRLKSAPDPAQLDAMNRELAARDAKIAELQQQLQAPPPPGAGAPPEDTGLLKGIEVTRDPAAGTVTVNLPGDVLFNSGSAELKQSARATLDKVISALKKDYSGKHILVEGHTDADPIQKTRGKWDDNLDLSAARARAVAQYLSSQGINGGQIGTRAYGPTKPKGGEKSRNRRVEIVVATR